MNDFQAVQKAVEKYFKSTYDQNIEGVLEVFHSDAHIVGMIGDLAIDLTVNDFAKRVEKQGQDYPYNKIIKTLSVNKDIAHAECYVQVGDMFFTDYLSLLKVAGVWRVRHKAFVAE
jgi:hypothetical protein